MTTNAPDRAAEPRFPGFATSSAYSDVARRLVDLIRPDAPAEVKEMTTGRSQFPSFSVLDCSKAAAHGVTIPAWEGSLERYMRSIREGDTDVCTR